MTARDLSRLLQPATFVTINIDNILFQKSVVAGICLFLIIIEFSVLLVSLNNEYKHPPSKSPSNITRSQGITFIAITYLNLGFRYYTILHFSLLEPELENLTENPLLLWLNHLYQILGMVVCVVCNILVVVGIKRDSPNYLIPWLAVYIVGIKYHHYILGS